MKACIACPGLEHVQRGYETFARELFHALRHFIPRNALTVHLCKSSGPRPAGEHVVPTLRRTNRLFNVLPQRYQTDYRRFQWECYFFGLAMVPFLCRERFDVIHFSEPPLGDTLKRIRRIFGLKYKLLFSNGGPWPPWDCARFDAVHQVSVAHDATGRAFGLPADRSFLVPYGIDGARLGLRNPGARESARGKFGLPETSFVVLSLAALNVKFKRVDWLIAEMAKLKGDVFLLLAGNREAETRQLEDLATKLMPLGNVRFLQVPYSEVPVLLSAADVLVQCSLDEGFGRVLTEAMGAGVPVLTHPHPTARWVVDNSDCFVDMTVTGDLAKALGLLMKEPSLRAAIAERNLVSFRRFEWEKLVPEYLKMYEAVVTLSSGLAAGRS